MVNAFSPQLVVPQAPVAIAAPVDDRSGYRRDIDASNAAIAARIQGTKTVQDLVTGTDTTPGAGLLNRAYGYFADTPEQAAVRAGQVAKLAALTPAATAASAVLGGGGTAPAAAPTTGPNAGRTGGIAVGGGPVEDALAQGRAASVNTPQGDLAEALHRILGSGRDYTLDDVARFGALVPTATKPVQTAHDAIYASAAQQIDTIAQQSLAAAGAAAASGKITQDEANKRADEAMAKRQADTAALVRVNPVNTEVGAMLGANRQGAQ